MNRTPRFTFCVVALGVCMAACSSSQMSRIDANRELYESWPIETRQAVLDGRVEAGMTPDMVEMAWGKPSEKTSNNAGEEIWVYRKGGDLDDGLPIGQPSVSMGGTVSGIGISTGRGGTSVGTSIGSGIGIGTGTGATVGSSLPPTPVDVREVVFRDGVVYRADKP